MVKEVKMFTVICDSCGKDVCDGTDYSGWNDEQYIEEVAKEANWIKLEDIHYCDNCYELDDDDNIILK